MPHRSQVARTAIIVAQGLSMRTLRLVDRTIGPVVIWEASSVYFFLIKVFSEEMGGRGISSPVKRR